MKYTPELRKLQKIAGDVIGEKKCRWCGKTKLAIPQMIWSYVIKKSIHSHYNYYCHCKREEHLYAEISRINKELGN